jgi:hypothetical protein
LKHLHRISVCILLLFATIKGNAQVALPENPLSNLRQRSVAVRGDTLLLDSLSIVPQTFSIAHIPDSTYRLDFVHAILYWNQKPATDSVQLTYRVFPYKLNAHVKRLNYDSVMNNFYVAPFEFNNNASAAKGLFDFGNIQYNGSFGRGLVIWQ